MNLPGLGQIVKAAANLVDDLHHSGQEKIEHELELYRAQAHYAEQERQRGHIERIAQIELNKVEAQHPSLFVAGWRPMVGWSLGVLTVLAFFLKIAVWPFLIWWYPGTQAPPIETTELLGMLGSLLGVSWLRSSDKRRGVDTKKMERRA